MKKFNFSIPCKQPVMASIHNRGIAETKKMAQSIADDCFVSKATVMSWIRKVEKGEIVIQSA